MALSDMEVFNKYFQPAIIETLAQMVDKFNASSGGAISLTTEGFEGDFLQRSFFQSLHSAVRRVDLYATNTAVAPTNLAQIKESGVKVAGGFGPIQYEPAQMTWLNKPTVEAIEVISRNFAEVMMADQLNTAILALVAAIENQAALVNDVSGASAVNYESINNAHGLYGDSSSSLITQVMSGAASHRMIGQNIGNVNRLFQATNVQVIDILGRLVVVTDAPALSEPGKDKVLSLASQAAVVYDGSDVITNIERSNGKQRIESTIQSDYSFGLSLLGYTWEEGSGGKSPSNAALGTGTNWTQTKSSIKHTAGVLTIGSAA